MDINNNIKEWRLAKSRNGITIHTSEYKGSAYRAYRATMLVAGSIEPYISIFEKVHEYKNWMHTTIISELVDRPSESEKIIYMVNRNIPITDRDYYASLITNHHDNGKVTVDWSLLDRPHVPGRVRVSKMSVKLSLTPTVNNQFEIKLDGHIEPGGIIPAPVANAFITDVPFNTFKKIRKLASSS